MRRIAITPRADWQARVEGQGLHFHTPDQQPYWDESAYYSFSLAQIDTWGIGCLSAFRYR